MFFEDDRFVNTDKSISKAINRMPKVGVGIAQKDFAGQGPGFVVSVHTSSLQIKKFYQNFYLNLFYAGKAGYKLVCSTRLGGPSVLI